jgi:hypothetical protein
MIRSRSERYSVVDVSSLLLAADLGRLGPDVSAEPWYGGRDDILAFPPGSGHATVERYATTQLDEFHGGEFEAHHYARMLAPATIFAAIRGGRLAGQFLTIPAKAWRSWDTWTGEAGPPVVARYERPAALHIRVTSGHAGRLLSRQLIRKACSHWGVEHPCGILWGEAHENYDPNEAGMSAAIARRRVYQLISRRSGGVLDRKVEDPMRARTEWIARFGFLAGTPRGTAAPTIESRF